MTAAATSLTVSSAPFSYEDVAPLDWFQWRCLLWDRFTQALDAEANPSGDAWEALSLQVNGECRESQPCSAAGYERAFRAVREKLPHLNSGLETWTRSLYRQVPRLLGGQPPFMNLGFTDDTMSNLVLEPADELFRLNIQLYERALGGRSLAGLSVLESGCGGGGGLSYLARYHRPASLAGIDLAPAETEGHQGWVVETGDASQLPFLDGQFDLAISIESTGHYERPLQFFCEAARVLKPGGMLCLADLRPSGSLWGDGRDLAALRHELGQAGFEIVEESDLSDGVVASIRAQDDGRRRFLDALALPATSRAHFDEIMLMPGSRNFDFLVSGDLRYVSLICRKSAAAARQAPVPHPWLEQLRETEPVHSDAAWGGWIVSGYADVSPLLFDARLSLEGAAQMMFQHLEPALRARLKPLELHVSKWLGVLDPGNHKRLRTILAKGFAPDVVTATRAVVRDIAGRLLDRMESGESIDLIDSYASPLPAMAIAAILGVPLPDAGRVVEWSKALTRFVGEGFQNPDAMLAGQTAVVEMTAYLESVVSRYGSSIHPEDTTLIARLLRAHHEDGITDMDEILANCVLLLFAGHETTTLAISNTALLLLRDRKWLVRVQEDGATLKASIEESLRCLSPVQMVRRQAVADFELRGRQVQKGEMVWLAIGAANRDPNQFPDAGCFVPGRKPSRNLAFGAGPHYCLGAALSLMETEVALSELIDRFPAIRLSSMAEPEWLPNPTAATLRSLPVMLRPKD